MCPHTPHIPTEPFSHTLVCTHTHSVEFKDYEVTVCDNKLVTTAVPETTSPGGGVVAGYPAVSLEIYGISGHVLNHTTALAFLSLLAHVCVPLLLLLLRICRSWRSTRGKTMAPRSACTWSL